jgi:hypothetical protein
MIQILNLTYNPNDASEYLEILNAHYNRYHWYYTRDHNDPRSIGSNNSLNTMHGYGLQTIYEDTTFPYHCDIDPHDEGPEYFRDTELVFGFFSGIKEKFTNVYRSFVMTFQPGDFIGKWTTGDKGHSRVFIPLITNGTAWLRYYNESQMYSVVPEVGKIYQISMTKNVSYANIINEGTTDISFIMFNTI